MWTKDYLVRGFVKRSRRRRPIGDYDAEWQALYRVEGARRALKQAKAKLEEDRRIVLAWDVTILREKIAAAEQARTKKIRDERWEKEAAKIAAEAKVSLTPDQVWMAWAWANGKKQTEIAKHLGYKKSGGVNLACRQYVFAHYPENLYHDERFNQPLHHGDRHALIKLALAGKPEPPRPASWREVEAPAPRVPRDVPKGPQAPTSVATWREASRERNRWVWQQRQAGFTLQQIGDALGLGRERIRQMQVKEQHRRDGCTRRCGFGGKPGHGGVWVDRSTSTPTKRITAANGSMTSGQIQLPRKLVDVFSGEALYRGAYGGRGSAKSRSFAKMAAVHGLRCAQAKQSGVIVCGREFQNSLDESSMAEVKQAIESEPWLHKNYEIGEKYIRTKDGRIDFTFVGLRRNIESVKSTARIRLLWVDEAEPVSEVAWQKAIPTVREEGAEVWITWNPERRASATNQRFRINPPLDSKIVEVNYKDNPWFPSVLEKIRAEDERVRPEQYAHVWLGDYATAHVGAYFARHLNEAQEEGRISKVMRDPLLPIRAYCDLGGTGAKSDAFAMWVCQFVGREVRILDAYESIGEPLEVHVQWLRDGGYGKADIYLPHDGATHDRVFDVSFESSFRQAGFKTEVIPNQGRGAAKMRIEAARRLFPSVWFNKETTEAGRDALGWYHERRSEDVRDVGLGPEHDWSSHAADAFGLMAIGYETPQGRPTKLKYERLGIV